MKVAAYTPLHYGKEYLKWALESTAPFVSKHVILYSPVPSYGHRTDLPCPDTEEELRDIVAPFKNIEWHEGRWKSWQKHWLSADQYVRGYDLLISADADEIWDLESAEGCLKTAYDARSARDWRCTRMVHFYRSFGWACTDNMCAARIRDLRVGQGTGYVPLVIYHFGYAESVQTVRYKWQIHLHQGELRPGWFEQKFLNWKPGDKDVHPTCVGEQFWSPKPFDRNTLPELLHDHPYYDLEIIE